jgi:hypothetical protein
MKNPTKTSEDQLFLGSGLPNYLISVFHRESSFLDTLVNQYLNLNNQKTIVFRLGRLNDRATLNNLRFNYSKASMVIDLLFKELQLRKLDCETGIEKFLGKRADLLLVIYNLYNMDNLLSTADSSQEGTSSFKLKKIIEEGKQLGIGIIAGSFKTLPVKNNTGIWFENRYRAKWSFENKQMIVSKIGEATPPLTIPYQVQNHSTLANLEEAFVMHRGREQPFNPSYELLLLSNQTSCLLEKPMQEIKTFRIKYRLGLIPVISEGLGKIYP